MYDEKIIEDIEKKYFEMNLKVAETGLVESMSKVAGMYFKGFGVEKNFDEAIKWLKKATDEGDESATIALADIYCEDKNVDRAIFYYSKAAEQNNIKAIQQLANIYELQQDFEKMFECCQKGAKLGNKHLMEKLADCYLFGHGVPQDDLMALDWFIKIIEIYGWNYSTHNVMRIITKIYSKHFKFTDKKFLKFYVTTEKLGIFNAIFGIASELYKTDKIRALKWYKMAADAGDFDAAVAVFYIRENDLDGDSGLSCYDNYVLALEWYKKAVVFGNINAAKNLLILDGLKLWKVGYLPDSEISICQLKKILETEGGNKNV